MTPLGGTFFSVGVAAVLLVGVASRRRCAAEGGPQKTRAARQTRIMLAALAGELVLGATALNALART